MPVDSTKRPTEREFDQYVEHWEKVWDGAWKAAKRANDFYWQRLNIWEDYYKRHGTPLGLQNRANFHDGTFPAKVDQIVNGRLALAPQFVRDPLDGGSASKTASGLLEKGQQVVVDDAFARAPNFPTRENGKGLVLVNHTGLLTLLSTSGLIKPERKVGEDKEDFEQREWEWMSSRHHWNPIEFMVPVMGEVLANPLETSPAVMIWRRTMLAYDLNALLVKKGAAFRQLRGVLRAFGGAWASVLQKEDAYEKIEVEEWWSVRWHGMKRKDGGELYWEPNTTWIQPYTQVWGGNAISPTGEAFDPKWWVEQAIMFKVMDEVLMQAQAKSAHHTLIMRAAEARLGTSGDTGELAEGMQHGILPFAENEVWLEKVPQLPAAAFQHLQSLEQSIEQHTVSSLMAGFKQSEIETARGMVILSERTDRALAAITTKMEALYSIGAGEKVLQLVYKLYRELGDQYREIGMGENKLRVRDMGDPPQFHMRASFVQVDAVVAMQEVQQEVMLWREGLSSFDQVQRVRRFEDPEGLRREIDRDRMLRDPDLMEEALINAFRVEGQLELAEKREAALRLRKLQRMMAPQQRAPVVLGGQQTVPTQPLGSPPVNGQGAMP